MHELPLTVLLVEDNPGDARLLRDSLAEDAGDAIRLLWVSDLGSAVDEAATELIDAVVLDLNLPDSNGFETFARMKAAAPGVPVIVLTGIEDDQLGFRAIQEGAQDYLSKGDFSGSKIARSLRYAVERHRSRMREMSRMKEAPRGKVIAFVGAKGGVGTTTVTLNVAALLARNTQCSVTAAELRSDFGSFAPLLHESPPHSIGVMLRFDLTTISDSVIEKCLIRSRFGFDVLFAPQAAAEYAALEPEAARQVVDRISRRSAYSLLDLPGPVCPATQGALPNCDFLVLVTERDPSSVASSERALRFLHEHSPGCPPAGLVVVNRSLMIDGFPPKQIASMLRCDLMGVVPPAPDVSVSSQRSGSPIAIHRPLSAPATMLNAITEKIARAVSEPAEARPRLESVPA